MTRDGDLRVAAVQLEAVLGDVATNAERLEHLIDEACAGGARLIAVPEFCSSRVVFDKRVHDAVLPPDNALLRMLRDRARARNVWIGGSMLIAEGDAVYNRYHLVEPDGAVHCHDKDLPTMWENAAYGPARAGDDGAFETGIGRLGVAMCWELIRTQTVRRLLDRVDIAVTGTHWWNLPSNWGRGTAAALAPLGQFNRYLSENAPAEFARRLGVPVLQASHCGRFRTGFLLHPFGDSAPPYDTAFVGATQIVDAEGRVLAQRRTQEGPGVVFASIRPGARTPVQPLEERFWIPDLPLFLRAYWHQQNLAARAYYRRHGRSRGLAAAKRHDAAGRPTVG